MGGSSLNRNQVFDKWHGHSVNSRHMHAQCTHATKIRHHRKRKAVKQISLSMLVYQLVGDTSTIFWWTNDFLAMLGSEVTWSTTHASQEIFNLNQASKENNFPIKSFLMLNNSQVHISRTFGEAHFQLPKPKSIKKGNITLWLLCMYRILIWLYHSVHGIWTSLDVIHKGIWLVKI